MRREIRYEPEGIVLDLGVPGLGHPDGTDILLRHYRQSENPGIRFSKSSPAFTCLKHQDGTNPGLFLKKTRSGVWFAVHYVGTDCASYRLPSPMSDEHKRQAEYWVRAAETAGYSTETEWRLHSGTRPDVLIRGPVMTGVEVQRSYIRRSAAVARTRKAELAGVKDVWFTDNSNRAGWYGRVPSVGQNLLPGQPNPWRDSVPRARAITATGLRKIVSLKCTVNSGYQCPVGRNCCGRYHPRDIPWASLAIDDVAEQFPAGQMLAIRLSGTMRKPGNIAIVSSADKVLYEELTGIPATPIFQPLAEDPRFRIGTPADCRNVQPQAFVLSQPIRPPTAPCITPGCGKLGRLYATGRWCDDCARRVREVRNQR
jgi:hypothetical protein